MEVHQHTHTSDSNRDRKKLTHYFWEFFMLFLAVIAGFLVENQREHYIEHKRAKVLASSFYNDFKNDITSLQSIIQHTQTRINHIDSFILELKKIPGTKNELNLSIHAAWLLRFQSFAHSKTTYEQVKASGMLRYFDLEFVNLLTAYDVLAEESRLREEGEYNILTSHLVYYVMDAMNFEAAYSIYFNQPLPDNIYFNINDRATANLMINRSLGMKINRMRLLSQFEKMKQKAEEILRFIKKEYHLE